MCKKTELTSVSKPTRKPDLPPESCITLLLLIFLLGPSLDKRHPLQVIPKAPRCTETPVAGTLKTPMSSTGDAPLVSDGNALSSYKYWLC